MLLPQSKSEWIYASHTVDTSIFREERIQIGHHVLPGSRCLGTWRGPWHAVWWPKAQPKSQTRWESYNSFFFCGRLFVYCQTTKKCQESHQMRKFIAWCHLMSNYSIPISNKHGAGSRRISGSKGCFPGKNHFNQSTLNWIPLEFLHSSAPQETYEENCNQSIM